MFSCFFFVILQNPVHLVSALRLGDILTVREKKREEGRREEKSAVGALSEDAALHTLALFCLGFQSEGNKTEDYYGTKTRELKHQEFKEMLSWF